MNPFAVKTQSLARVVRRLGWLHAARLKGAQWIARAVPRSMGLTLRTPLSPHPLRVRSRTSDPRVFHQIFIDLQYDCLPADLRPDLIVDAGSNIGLAAVFLLERWPASRLIAIEPDPGNLALARKNLAPYGARATVVPGAVWSHRTRLHLTGADPREAWAFRTVPAPAEATGDTEAYSLPDLLALAGHRPGESVLLKMDVEGAETAIFGEKEDLSWFDAIDTVAIELHGPAAEAQFKACAAGRTLLEKHGETWICR